jgi:intracellular multiplication protein IcmE
LLGSFTSGKESLAIHYITLVDPVGNDYAVTAYAVSPDTDKAAIATNVDNHMLERWGGLTAAAFLKGFGQATLLSGTQSVGGPLVNQGIGQSANPGYYGGYITQAPQYDLMQKGAVAMGEVGNQAAQQLSKNFNQPPTVTLAAGAPLGILFIK